VSGNPVDDYHKLLVRQNIEKIELAAVKAFGLQVKCPVVLLLDPTDPVAKAIEDTAGSHPLIDSQVAEFVLRGITPVLTWHLPGNHAHELLAKHYPDLEPFIPLAGAGEFYCVVLSRGGISTGVLQLP
jgi:hypothetical protein